MLGTDAREAGRERRETYRSNHKDQTLTFTVTQEDDEGEFEQDVTVPAKYEVCATCEGRGKHVNPAIDSHGISGDEFAEDPDFRDDYFSGAYDVDCYECRGRSTVLVADPDRMNDEQKKLLALREEQDITEAEFAAEAAYEQRMGY